MKVDTLDTREGDFSGGLSGRSSASQGRGFVDQGDRASDRSGTEHGAGVNSRDVGVNRRGRGGAEVVGVGPGVGDRWYRQGERSGSGVRRDARHADRANPSRNLEAKGMTERNDGDLETSFLPGRELASATRLGRDYSVRVAGNDYSTHPSAIGMGGASRSPRAWAR